MESLKPVMLDEQRAAVRQAIDRARKLKTLLAPKPIVGVDDWGILPEPEEDCDPDRADQIAHFLSLRASGHRLNDHLQKNKAFRNPRIYAKLVEIVDVDEIGSNFPMDDYDPHGFPESSYIGGIMKSQRKVAEDRVAAQRNRTQVPFVSGSNEEQGSDSAPPPKPQDALAAAKAAADKISSRLSNRR